MEKVLKEDQVQVYEIGYLLVSTIPEEKVTSEVASLKETLTKKGAEFIGEEAPELRTLAYTMIKKRGTSNHRRDHGGCGGVKFSLRKKDIEGFDRSIHNFYSTIFTLNRNQNDIYIYSARQEKIH